MATQYSTAEMRNGIKVLLDGKPYTILENEMVKPGKGQAFNRIKFQSLEHGRVIEKTLKSGDQLPAADVQEIVVQYLYQDGNIFHFFHPTNYEQYEVSADKIGEQKVWLKETDLCYMTLFEGNPVSILPQTTVVLRIAETDPGVKGDTATGGSKQATLETGAIVRVPLFIQIGELIKINTRTGEYLSRAKDEK